ncbi:hypothetical protein A0H81_01194 [Grifola frondosa]|uniref:Major facilitator superfamily (MFS) profile domain-containing protein n=1 Tax=Grifola frondosa TaxID=5627 RepID=A0A1C7MRL8_GRIFR|nr:hypothetical protein A0H81_01194 [Grifola frondosa]
MSRSPFASLPEETVQAITEYSHQSLRSNSPITASEKVESINETDVTATLDSDTKDVEVVIVDWDGPNDPENQESHWPQRRKWAAALTVSAFTFISPVSSSMVAPAASQIADAFGIHESFKTSLNVSIFVLAYAVGPLFLGPLCEIFGRVWVLRGSNIFFLAWNLGCGFAQSEGQLIAFRFLAGIGGSAPLACGGAVLGDMWTPEERGQAIAIYSLAPLLGPVIGPIAGAWIAELSTWRWVFWSTSIAAGVIQIFGFFALRETFAPVLLEQKAKRIRLQKDVENGPVQTVRTVHQTSERRDYKDFIFRSLVRPFILFAQEPIIQLLGLYLAFVYGVIYLVLTTIPGIYTNIYHEKVGIVGLHYASLGIGLTIATQINARLLDKVYVYLKNRNGGLGEPEFRLPCVMPGTLLLPIGLLIQGWAAQEHVHWIVTDIGFAIIGAGIILTFQGMQTYIIDAFTNYAASALAAVSCLRSLAGFGFPLFAPAMYNALGYGVGNTILAAVAFVVGCPAIWVFWIWGERIRALSKHAKKK